MNLLKSVTKNFDVNFMMKKSQQTILILVNKLRSMELVTDKKQ
jgi:hypothetical protein